MRAVSARDYVWRNDEQLAAITDRIAGARRFSYDNRGRLIAEDRGDSRVLRLQDATGNIFQSEALDDRVYDRGGRLVVADGTRFRYDADNNLVERVEPDGHHWNYRWNGHGLLTEAKSSAGVEVKWEDEGWRAGRGSSSSCPLERSPRTFDSFGTATWYSTSCRRMMG